MFDLFFLDMLHVILNILETKGPLGWEENGRGKKVGGKKTRKKENWEENIIPYVAWMEEGKHRGKKTGKCQSDKNTLIVNTLLRKLYILVKKIILLISQQTTSLEFKLSSGNKYNNLLFNINIILLCFIIE